MRALPRLFWVLTGLLVLVAPGAGAEEKGEQSGPAVAEPRASLDACAETFVRLVLALGRHDADYVDAYYGPPEWQAEADAEALSPGEIRSRAERLLADLRHALPPGAGEAVRARHRRLVRSVEALIARSRMVAGERFSFDEESRALYDVVAPDQGSAHYRRTLARIAKLLPGEGPVHTRFAAWGRRFVIPRDRVDDVIEEALAEARRRTRAHLSLPEGERCEVRYVTGEPWGAYNHYQGNYRSRIEVNLDSALTVPRALLIACHEAYPGHHVMGVLQERLFLRERGWMEFSVYPLFGPDAVIAEGTANYGYELAFPRADRIAFLRDEILPLLGLDPGEAERCVRFQELSWELGGADLEAARAYLDGERTRREAALWLSQNSLWSPSAARGQFSFVDRYRSYLVGYSYGRRLVGDHVRRHAGADAEPARRWKVFEEILLAPRLPSELLPPPSGAGERNAGGE